MGFKTYLFILALLVSVTACKKSEGKGGYASIKGRVWGYQVTQTGIKVDSSFVQSQQVYISYGKNNATIDNDCKTNNFGEFVFDELQEGDYTLWVYGDRPLYPLEQWVDSLHVQVNDKKQIVTTRHLITYDEVN